ncbi:hypothetical protein C8Q72DRAFT_944223 [Fomitopsis betulina]|nr:hypothetical protein C8Q72DRAFT_944223 [Fomitopsis betulina]
MATLHPQTFQHGTVDAPGTTYESEVPSLCSLFVAPQVCDINKDIKVLKQVQATEPFMTLPRTLLPGVFPGWKPPRMVYAIPASALFGYAREHKTQKALACEGEQRTEDLAPHQIDILGTLHRSLFDITRNLVAIAAVINFVLPASVEEDEDEEQVDKDEEQVDQDEEQVDKGEEQVDKDKEQVDKDEEQVDKDKDKGKDNEKEKVEEEEKLRHSVWMISFFSNDDLGHEDLMSPEDIDRVRKFLKIKTPPRWYLDGQRPGWLDLNNVPSYVWVQIPMPRYAPW